MKNFKAFIQATIFIYIAHDETIVEMLEVAFDPATSGYSGPIYGFLSAIADRVAALVAAKQVEEITLEVDFNDFGQGAMPYDLPVTASAANLLDHMYSDSGLIKDVYCYLVSSVES